jgi:hypothetical protein
MLHLLSPTVNVINYLGSGLFLFLEIIDALSKWTALPLLPIDIMGATSVVLTLVDLLAVHDEVVDVALDLDEWLILLSLLLLACLHDASNVVREEVGLLRVDDVEEELSVDSLQCSRVRICQVWQVLLQQFVFESILEKVSDSQLWHLWNVD